MDPEALMALIGQCAGPSAPPALVYAIVEEESGGHRLVVRDNKTGTVHHFHSYSAAITFVKAHARHSLDIGLMQINTKAHRVRPERVLSPCENIRAGTSILSRDMARSGQNLREALCLYLTFRNSNFASGIFCGSGFSGSDLKTHLSPACRFPRF